MHILLAGVAFASIAWAAAIAPAEVPSHGIAGFLSVLGWLIVVTSVACGLAMSRALHGISKGYFGALERVFYLAMIVWFGVVSAELL